MQSHLQVVKTSVKSKCALCKGSKMLCGKSSCPILLKLYVNLKTKDLMDGLHLDGSSPPGVFIGRIGYPSVSIGPLVPPVHGDTGLLDTPELWLGKSIEDIVRFRFQLVRGKHRVRVDQMEGDRLIEYTRELGLSMDPTETEVEFLKKPSGNLVLDDNSQPFGPSAPLKKLDIGTLKIDHRIDKAYSDTDLKAKDAIIGLFEDGTMVSKIQRAFSVGAFGLKNNRRFVPTRWSITAIDDTISKELVKEVKDYPLINEYRIFESWELDNRFVIIMMPLAWSYELIEAWYPNTVWNPRGSRTMIYGDHEGYNGKSKYASIGGCYYAARLAVNEYLTRERRQARVVILREAHSGYILPVGVWNVRENVRNALRGESRNFDTLNEALNYIGGRLDIDDSMPPYQESQLVPP
ncbi:MAG: Nre family DNA repair protein [Halobacteriota archaeon]|nr:Nre family DNA repair protein [Halobacteriota archaeon]